MTEEELYENLPGDSETAFLHLEKYFLDKCDSELQRSANGYSHAVAWVKYMNYVLNTLRELELSPTLSLNEAPLIQKIDEPTYINFRNSVDHYKAALKIRCARRKQGYSVRFDAATKEKMRHYLQKIRDILDKLEIDQRKKEALFQRVDALAQEIDRDRTHFDAFGALVIESAGVLDDAAGKMGNVRKVIDSLAHLFWGARQESELRLPPRTEPKKIEPPQPRMIDQEEVKPHGSEVIS